MGKAVLAGAIGLISLAVGGILAAFRPPGEETRGGVQHVAAGTVFAGLVSDVLPRLLEPGISAIALITGMAIGLSAMMLIRSKGEKQGGTTLAITIIADVLTDGILIGLSIAAGSPTGYVFVAALAPEMILLGVTFSQEFAGEDATKRKRIGAPALLGVGVVAGAALGPWARSGPEWVASFIEAFGAIALAYLVTEELLREAHRRPGTAAMAALFFAGFIPLFILAALVH